MDAEQRIAELERRVEALHDDSHDTDERIFNAETRLTAIERAQQTGASDGGAKGSNVKVVDRREWEVLIEQRDAAILEMGARDNEVYKLSNILLACYGGPVAGETACEMAARLLKELAQERDAAVRERDEALDTVESQARRIVELEGERVKSAALRAACVRLAEALDRHNKWIGEDPNVSLMLAVREIVALVEQKP